MFCLSQSIRTTLSAGLLGLLLATQATAQCDLTWRDSVSMPGTNARITDFVNVPGQGLYACGWFSVAGDTFARRVAHWNGASWNPLGTGIDATPECIAALPNGDIVVGGLFQEAGGLTVNNIARWDGSNWSAMGAGFNNVVHELHVLPNGDLLAGGVFTASGGQSLDRLARWDGTSWQSFASGITTGVVRAIESLPNGDVVVGGDFFTVNGANANGLGIWDGTSWTLPGVAASLGIFAIETLPEGGFAMGGHFGLMNENVATYANGQISYLQAPATANVRAVLSASNGDLIVGGGAFYYGISNNVSRLRQGTWTVLDNGLSKTFALAEIDGELVAAGGSIGTQVDPTIRSYDGTRWTPLGSGGGLDEITALVSAADHGVFVGGKFTQAIDSPASNVAFFDGTNWTALGAGVEGQVTSMALAPNGDLIVAGAITAAGGAPTQNIARWDGSNWSTIGGGVLDPPECVIATAEGSIVTLHGPAPLVRVFDGVNWSNLPPVDTGTPIVNPQNLIELADGSLVITGIGNSVAWRWDGSSWSTMGSGFSITRAIAVGPTGEVYIAGTSANGEAVRRWDGTEWQVVANAPSIIADITVLPDGDVVVGGIENGSFGGVGRLVGNSIVTIDGGIGEGLGTSTRAEHVAFTNDGELIVAGWFASLGGMPAFKVGRARSTCPASATTFGSGCVGGAGPVTLQSESLPWMGSTHRATASGMTPQSLAMLAFGSTPLVAGLPTGAPGCSLFVQPEILDLRIPTAGQVDASIAIPATGALAGLTVRTQIIGIEFDPQLTIDRLTSSNALELTIGGL
jgi:trimeric autotransporter adhesin